MRAHTVPVPLHIWSPAPPLHGLAAVQCVHCGGYLDWHQPDPGAPDRLLGICENCGRWHLMAVLEEGERHVLMLLPEPDQVQDALG